MAFTVPVWCKGKLGAGVSNRPRTTEGIHLFVTGIKTNTLPLDTLDRHHSANPTGQLPYGDTHWETTGFSRDPLALTDKEVREEHGDNLNITPLQIYPAMRGPRWKDTDEKQFNFFEGKRLTDPTLETVQFKEETVKRDREIDMDGYLIHHSFLPSCHCTTRSQDIFVPPQVLVEERQVDTNTVISKEIRQQKVSSDLHGSSRKHSTRNHSLDFLTCVKREAVNTSVTTKATRPSRSGRQMDNAIAQQALRAGFELFDNNRNGLISRPDFLRVLHEFGFTIGDDELDNLLSRNDKKDQVKYREFLCRCCPDIKAVNLAGYTVPRQSVSWIPLPQVNTYVTPLVDQHVQDANPSKDQKLKSPRVLPEIEALLCNVLKKRITMFTQHFKYMSRKQYGRIDRLQFGRVLKLYSVYLLECELDQLWISLPTDEQNMLTFKALLDHFLISPASPKKVSEQDSHANGIITKNRYGQMNAKMNNRKCGFTCGTDQSENQNSKDNTFKHTRLHYLCGKVKLQVQSQRDYLMTYFQTRDRMGLSHIASSEMKVLMDRLYFNLSSPEKEELCQMFDFHNRGRFFSLYPLPRVFSPCMRRSSRELRQSSCSESIIDDLSEGDVRELLMDFSSKMPSVVLDIYEKSRSGQGGSGSDQPAGPTLEWCICTNCVQMPTAEERVCCGHLPEHCVSLMAEIDLYILDPLVLRLQQTLCNDFLALHAVEVVDVNKAYRHAS